MMNIFEQIKHLNLPSDQFIVLGSGIMEALGIRRVNDIDLLVTSELFDNLKTSGWSYEIVTIDNCLREKISLGNVEAYKDFKWNGGRSTLTIERIKPEVINEVPFLPLTVLRTIKVDMGREKDLVDLRLIDEYIRKTI